MTRYLIQDQRHRVNGIYIGVNYFLFIIIDVKIISLTHQCPTFGLVSIDNDDNSCIISNV